MPWKTAEGFDVEVRRVIVDGSDATNLIRPAERQIQLHRRDGWRSALIEVVCSAERPSSADGVVAASALLTNSAAKSRISIPLRAAGTGWIGELLIDREDVVGRGQLDAVLSGTVATVGHRWLGSGTRWTVDFDPPAEPPPGSHSPIPVVWESFKNPEDGPPLLAAYGTNTHYLDTSQAEPILYLNTDVDRLRDLLNAEKLTGWKADLQKSLAHDIGAQVLLGLVHLAISEVEDDGDGGFSGPYRASTIAAFDLLAEHIEGASSAEELKEQVIKARQSLDTFAALSARVSPAIGKITDSGKSAARLGGKVFGSE